MRLVVDIIRHMSVAQAENQLQFIPRRASIFILKSLRSAVANAEHNFNLKKDNLYIKKVLVNEGPALKRWTPKAFGRATPIKKRSSHLEIVLAEHKPTEKLQKHKIAATKPKAEEISVVAETEVKETKDALKKYVGRPVKDQKFRPKQSGARLKIFRRKAI